MIVVIGLLVLLIAVIVAATGVLGNAGSSHSLTDSFSVFGYHVTGSTGTLFFFGIVIGAVAMLGLCLSLAGARRTAVRGRDARRDLARSQQETEFANRDRETLLDRQHTPERVASHAGKESLLRRWSHTRQPPGQK